MPDLRLVVLLAVCVITPWCEGEEFPQSNTKDGKVEVLILGELKQWHNVTLNLNGPYASEDDNAPNPFTDYRFEVEFTHESGAPRYVVPGYFDADGKAKDSSAVSGNCWRAHLAPDKVGNWSYVVRFRQGKNAAVDDETPGVPLEPFDGVSGSFDVVKTDKTGRDWRAQGRLEYVGERYLRTAGSGRYFLKAGADAPETLLAYADFDGTVANNPRRGPLKSWEPHVQDWQPGDPVWQGDKGKGLIGAVNYLSGKGCNAFSFLTYNAGGDGDNVWPFLSRDDKLHYDCSKLDQWNVVFDHSTRKGMYLHFKLQETENDDQRTGNGNKSGKVPVSLDGGKLGVERKLYLREMIARFGHQLALNWNLGEENTQSTQEQNAMLEYIAKVDPYNHLRVVHTFPNQQDRRYGPLLGDASQLTGVSLQNSHIRDTHHQTVKWVKQSTESGKPWVVAFDESGSAAHGQCPDLGYRGFDGHDSKGNYTYTEHDVRRQTLWGNLMAGGAGVEYYFGYSFPENDLLCEDWRSRDRSWDYCRIALEFFASSEIPFWEATNRDDLVGNAKHDNSVYCLAKPGEFYLVYLPTGGKRELDLSDAAGEFTVEWFNPRSGELVSAAKENVQGGAKRKLGPPPSDVEEDWLVVLKRP